ncbi:glutamate ABC transporter substrate-binding protein [Cellulomonas shaoxiangyii]|uniref:Glutamate ABC transporter substrate-binding protein n=1 Tax=Cellulomonas shaoxiangyii TaxID=2566013 RepID=A0A4P7SI66_9CELL|nr:glutamate ABC transporter substrate-binding protein [Cellulomonas shaoxiangyii]QCB93929.1 glutamate ABC transporter substrate-binding protein [Cellulomonas shaoxiangyii]TGY86002.1 glutamate ABC transporter substrate-binding protein [Cellulomonas shaoxiangyii]
MRSARTGLIALLSASTLALAACSGGDAGGAEETDGAAGGSTPTAAAEFPEGSTMARLAEEGITIGTKFDQPLFGLVGPDGTPTGFDVEIGKIVAERLGVAEDDIEWVETISANREQFIQSGQVDIVVATYTINDTRKEVVSFAGPYYEAGQSILTLKSDEDIQGPDDLAGKSVCTVSGSTPEKNLLENYPEAKVQALQAYSDCIEPLRNGQVDAISTDNVILAGFAAQNDDLEVRGDAFTKEPYGIGLALEDTEFRNWINDVLEESYEDGSWEQAWESTVGSVLETPEPPAVDRY